MDPEEYRRYGLKVEGYFSRGMVQVSGVAAVEGDESLGLNCPGNRFKIHVIALGKNFATSTVPRMTVVNVTRCVIGSSEALPHRDGAALAQWRGVFEPRVAGDLG
jgi:hypothetical protein